MLGFSRRSLETLARTALPSLRAVALAYTALGGMLALVLILAVALTPVAPSLTEPARQAVTNIVQPTGDALVTLFGGPPAAPPAPVFTSSATLDVTISDVPLPQPDAEEAVTPEAPATDVIPTEPQVVSIAPVSTVAAPAPVEVDETAPGEEVAVPDESVEPVATPLPDVVAPAEPVQEVAAVAEPPRPLPVVVPQTAEQVKARMDAENQAAIDAMKASAAKAKADADAANEAAIAAQKAATATAVAPAPTSAAVPQANIATPAPMTSKAAADAANQAAIDAAKASKAQAKAAADAANQAAIDRAKGKAPAPTPTPVPTAVPTHAPAPPPPAPAPPAPIASDALSAALTNAEDQAADDDATAPAPSNEASAPEDVDG